MSLRFARVQVREDVFYCGYDKAGALNEHAHLPEFMQRTARNIVETALEIAEPAPQPVEPVAAEGAEGDGEKEEDEDEDEDEDEEDDDDDDENKDDGVGQSAKESLNTS